jgi:peroxiredoxin
MKERLRLALLLAAVIAVAFAYARLQEGKGYALQRGKTAPALRLPTLAGEFLDLQALRGKVVVLNFWATWCAPCVAEMPSLERLHRALKSEKVAVVSVSVDDEEAVLSAFVRERGLTFPVLRDPGGPVMKQVWRTTGVPETFVIDAAGVLLEHHVGPEEWDAPETLSHLRQLAARSATPAP